MNKKKIIIWLMTFVMLFSNLYIPTVAADYDIYKEEGLLKALKIVEAELPTVTRADFAEIIVKAMNIDVDANSDIELSFLDVEKEHPKYNYIAAAKLYGIMRGYSDEVFSPYKAITAGEAISVVVSSIGDLRVQNGMNYYDAARDNKLLKNMNGATGAELSYEQMVILIYNFLHANMLSDVVFPYQGTKPSGHESVLKTFFDIEIYEEVVYANECVAIKGDPTDENCVRVGSRTFSDEAGFVSDMLGCYVRCYYTDKGRNEIVYGYADYNKTEMEILPLDETEYLPGRLKYDREEYRYNATTSFIYNSELVTDPAVLETAFSGSGTVKLISSDHSSNYDTIVIEQYIMGELESINTYTETIKLKGKAAVPYGQYRNTLFKKSDGSVLLPEDILAGNVVGIALPKTTNGAVRIVKCDSEGVAVIGTVAADEKIVTTQEGIEYKALLDISTLKLGEEYELYIDEFGNLVFAVKSETTKKFGYVVAAAQKSGLGKTLQVKLLLNSGEVKIFEQKDKVKVRLADGTFKRLNAAEVIDALKGANGGFIRQPVMYSIANDDSLKELWIVSTDLKMEFHTLEKLLLNNTDGSISSLVHRRAALSIGGIYNLRTNTVLYKVPRYDYEIKNEELDLVVGTTYTNLLNSGTFYGKETGKVDYASDVTNLVTAISFAENSLTADVVVLEELPDYSTNFGPNADQPMVVTKIKYARNAEGEDFIQVTGYTLGGMMKTYDYYDDYASGLVGITNARRSAAQMTVATAKYAPISLGDIVKFNEDAPHITRNNTEIYYRNDMDENGISDPISYDNLIQHQTTYSTYRYYDSARVTPAEVLRRQGDIFILKVCANRNSELDANPRTIKERDETYSITTAPVYFYRKSDNSIERMTSDVISEGDKFILVTNGGNVQFAVYYE